MAHSDFQNELFIASSQTIYLWCTRLSFALSETFNGDLCVSASRFARRHWRYLRCLFALLAVGTLLAYLVLISRAMANGDLRLLDPELMGAQRVDLIDYAGLHRPWNWTTSVLWWYANNFKQVFGFLERWLRLPAPFDAMNRIRFRLQLDLSVHRLAATALEALQPLQNVSPARTTTSWGRSGHAVHWFHCLLQRLRQIAMRVQHLWLAATFQSFMILVPKAWHDLCQKLVVFLLFSLFGAVASQVVFVCPCWCASRCCRTSWGAWCIRPT